MKTLITVFFLVITIQSFGNNYNLFSYDSQLVQDEFSQLSKLESEVSTLAGTDVTVLSTLNPLLKKPVGLNSLSENEISFPFCWGCVFGPMGWLYVVVSTNRLRKPSTDAFKGCMVGTAFYTFITVGGHEIWGWWPGLYTAFK